MSRDGLWRRRLRLCRIFGTAHFTLKESAALYRKRTVVNIADDTGLRSQNDLPASNGSIDSAVHDYAVAKNVTMNVTGLFQCQAAAMNIPLYLTMDFQRARTAHRACDYHALIDDRLTLFL